MRPRSTGRSSRSASRSRTSGASTSPWTSSSSTARSGQTWFQAPRDPEVAVAVAQDFMRHLATWHRAGARALDLPSFGPVRSVREHQLDQLEGIRAAFDAEDAREPIDLLARVQLDHLLHRVPDFDGEPVLVQGDTGPGNFMYDGDRVTAIVDWELAHIGDPMDDIAWLSWRATQHGWPDFPARLREYEDVSGVTVDTDRVQVLPPERVRAARTGFRARRHGPGGAAPARGDDGRDRRRRARPDRRRQRLHHEHAASTHAAHRAGRRDGHRAAGARRRRRSGGRGPRVPVRRRARPAQRHRRPCGRPRRARTSPRARRAR